MFGAHDGGYLTQVELALDPEAVWSSQPAWRSQRTLYVACAQVLELGEAVAQALVGLAETVRDEVTGGKVAGQFYEVSDEEAAAIMNVQVDEE